MFLTHFADKSSMSQQNNIALRTSITLCLILFFAPFISNVCASQQGLAIFLILGVVGVIWWKLKHRGGKYRERRYFSTAVKKETLRDQNYKCAICKKRSEIWDYDHIDGNRSHNEIN
ncbi:MAG: hypothetical protein WAM14_24250, partial [Candidatus Nitrosopolaris sp.]